MPAKSQGTNIGALFLVLVLVLVFEGILDVFGLPFDEILVPGEIIGDIMLMILMALFSNVGYTPTRRIR